MLFRLETMNRNSIEFEDETQLSKDECASLLEEQLEALTECDIAKVRFPFFDLENQDNSAEKPGETVTYKFRPCVVLYGNSRPSVYLAIYNGKPEQTSLYDWELALSAPEDLSPDSAPVSVVDVSKMCGLPETYDDPEQEFHGMNTYAPWFMDPVKKRHPIAPVQPGALRGKIVALLMKLLVNNPYLDSYFDSTIEHDIGTMVDCKVLINGEWCYRRQVYAGPEGMSSERHDLAVQTMLSPSSKSPAARFPGTPKVTP